MLISYVYHYTVQWQIEDSITNTVWILKVFSADSVSMYLYSVQLFDVPSTRCLSAIVCRAKGLVYDMRSCDGVTAKALNVDVWNKNTSLLKILSLLGLKMYRIDSFGLSQYTDSVKII